MEEAGTGAGGEGAPPVSLQHFDLETKQGWTAKQRFHVLEECVCVMCVVYALCVLFIVYVYVSSICVVSCCAEYSVCWVVHISCVCG